MASISKAQIASEELYTSKLLSSSTYTASTNEILLLETALEKIQESYNVSFLYDSEILKGKYVQASLLQADSLAQMLSETLSRNGLTYSRESEQQYVIKKIPYFRKNNLKKAIRLESVSGTVSDGNTGETLPGVNIVVKGTNTGTSTNSEGAYSLNVPSLQDTLVFSFIGYQTQEVPIQGRTEIDVSMQLSAISGEELVVVGYGTQRRESLTGSISSVSTNEMSAIPVPTVTHALQGMAPGMQILDGGDMPGNNVLDVLVRGQGSLGRGGDTGSAAASRPLVLIDGIEGNLANVDMEDVESISVLKDAASAAIYGSRAANGVILVTTKRGNAGDLQITYNGYYGSQDMTSWPDRVDTETHMRLANVARTNLLNACLDGREGQTEAECRSNPSYAPRYTEEYIQNTIAGDQPDEYPSDELVDAIFSPAPIQDHNLSVSGGNVNARYNLSLNYLKEEGMMANTGH
ncbi:MAG: carboxypeptidase-like regulatory domain-containing protein [Balneolaceae bacterium]|nr:carboxypeptidase-like regulatory domain-containing protein [Balneolaceae bacterium]